MAELPSTEPSGSEEPDFKYPDGIVTTEQKIELLKSQCNGLKNANMQLIARIGQTGFQLPSLSAQRHDKFIEYIVAINVITPQQYWEFNFFFEQELLESLTKLEEDVQQQIRRMQLTMGTAAAAAGAPGLLVPPGARGAKPKPPPNGNRAQRRTRN